VTGHSQILWPSRQAPVRTTNERFIESSGTARADICDKKVGKLENTQTELTHRMIAVLEKADGKSMEFGIVISALSGGSHAVLFVFLSFPLCIPVGIPVLSTALGLTLGLVGFLDARSGSRDL
jgi:hypothetical protein